MNSQSHESESKDREATFPWQNTHASFSSARVKLMFPRMEIVNEPKSPNGDKEEKTCPQILKQSFRLIKPNVKKITVSNDSMVVRSPIPLFSPQFEILMKYWKRIGGFDWEAINPQNKKSFRKLISPQIEPFELICLVFTDKFVFPKKYLNC